MKWLLSLLRLKKIPTKRSFRVQIFPECIRVHPKDLDKKIKNIEETSLQIFAEAYKQQKKVLKNGS
jgi:hypothetical protein